MNNICILKKNHHLRIKNQDEETMNKLLKQTLPGVRVRSDLESLEILCSDLGGRFFNDDDSVFQLVLFDNAFDNARTQQVALHCKYL